MMHLKTLVDNLRDVGQPVSEPNQVLNMLRGLNPRYRHVQPIITAKFLPHTFLSARSYLILEELCLNNDTKADAGRVFYAGHSSSIANTGRNTGSNTSGTTNPSSSFPNSKNKQC